MLSAFNGRHDGHECCFRPSTAGMPTVACPKLDLQSVYAACQICVTAFFWGLVFDTFSDDFAGAFLGLHPRECTLHLYLLFLWGFVNVDGKGNQKSCIINQNIYTKTSCFSTELSCKLQDTTSDVPHWGVELPAWSVVSVCFGHFWEGGRPGHGACSCLLGLGALAGGHGVLWQEIGAARLFVYCNRCWSLAWIMDHDLLALNSLHADGAPPATYGTSLLPPHLSCPSCPVPCGPEGALCSRACTHLAS